MYLKAAGIVLMLLGGAGLGVSASRRLSMRLDNLRLLLRMTAMLKGEISYGASSLPEAFASIGRRIEEPFGGFLCYLAARMEEGGGDRFSLIFQEGMEKYLRESGLNREDQTALFHLGAQLGYQDRVSQLRQVELYEQEVGAAVEKLQGELPERKKVCQTLGLLGGMFLSVFLL